MTIFTGGNLARDRWPFYTNNKVGLCKEGKKAKAENEVWEEGDWLRRGTCKWYYHLCELCKSINFANLFH